MVDNTERLQKAEEGYAKAQSALDEVGKILSAAEKAQAAADRAHEAAENAHEALRKLTMILPVVGVALALAVWLARRGHTSKRP